MTALSFVWVHPYSQTADVTLAPNKGPTHSVLTN